jgi:hypothetical protein
LPFLVSRVTRGPGRQKTVVHGPVCNANERSCFIDSVSNSDDDLDRSLCFWLCLIFSHLSQFKDIKDETITLSDSGLDFKGKSSGKDYSVSIEFFKDVDAEGSTYKVLPRSVQMHILKKDKEDEAFWPRLLKDKALEKNQVNIDWDRYVDEDEEDGGFDMSALEGGQG